MFKTLQAQVQAQFDKLVKNGVLYHVATDRDVIWETYLQSFPEAERQENNCNCCKSFLRQFGNIVAIKDGVMTTLWDIEPDAQYAGPIKRLRDYVAGQPVAGVFFSEQAKAGSPKTYDPKNDVTWNHFALTIPREFVKRDFGSMVSGFLDDKNVLRRSLDEITDDAVDTVLELIGQNSLYRGNDYKANLNTFRKLKKDYKGIKNTKKKDFFCWEQSRKVGSAFSRIRNTAIGTLLVDLSEGKKSLDQAVSAFEKMVAPANYKRPTALVTPRMVEDAKKRLEELNLVGALNRRQLATTDLTVNNSIYVHRTNNTALDVFEQIKQDVVVNPKSLSKVEEISIDNFIGNILPTAKSVNVLLENSHLNNFVSLVGPQNPDDKGLFKWDNDYSWSYAGELADSIKERVKQAGGKVDGFIRISLSWSNSDDLDLHMKEPGGHTVYYGNKGMKSPAGATLDVDMNAFSITKDPVENIFWTEPPKKYGTYQISVHNFNRRTGADTGFEVEIEHDGQTYNFEFKSNGAHGKMHNIITFDYTKENGFVIKADSKLGNYNSREKWGIKTGQWHKVNAITFSPNHWENEKGIGNKHFFFFLDKCVSDENIRPFYNEFLRGELDKDRKVFEVLGSKIKVEKVPSELSGIGFSETIRNHVFVEVVGQFKRILKVKF